MVELKPLDSFKKELKDHAIKKIKETLARLFAHSKFNPEDVLILQFGSASFKADDLVASDFDIVLVLQYKQVKEAFPNLCTTDIMRDSFFFGGFAKALRSEEFRIYPVKSARNPILKVHLISDKGELDIDISFALVANSSLTLASDDSMVNELQPIDSISQNCVMAVRVCLTIS